MADLQTSSKLKAHRAWSRTCVVSSLFSFWLTSACQTSCGNGNQPTVLYVDGTTHTDNAFRVYETSPYDGQWLDFPSYRRFKLQHNLGTMDYTPVLYIAFVSHPGPSNSDAGGDVAIASGDVAVIDDIDPCYLLIRNATCSEQYLYVKITAPSASSGSNLCNDGGVAQ